MFKFIVVSTCDSSVKFCSEQEALELQHSDEFIVIDVMTSEVLFDDERQPILPMNSESEAVDVNSPQERLFKALDEFQKDFKVPICESTCPSFLDARNKCILDVVKAGRSMGWKPNLDAQLSATDVEK